MASSLVNGNKAALLRELQALKPVHGKKWRSLLKKYSKWHNQDDALHAWQNASRGKAGNEVLRKIVEDMRAIIESESEELDRTVTKGKLSTLRNSAIANSLKNLNSKKGKPNAKKSA